MDASSTPLMTPPVPLEQLPYPERAGWTITSVGPGLSGRSTSILFLAGRFGGELIHGQLGEARVLGALVKPFEAAPETAVRLLSAAGSITHPKLSRRLLEEADSYVLLVDAQKERLPTSRVLLRELRVRQKPIVVQVNKLDLPNAVRIEEAQRQLAIRDEVLIGSIATTGKGVIEAFCAALEGVSL